MKIAILGGTGHIGEGFALRWAKNNKIFIGSRSADKAKSAAKSYLSRIEQAGVDMANVSITGHSNIDAAEMAELIVLSVEYKHVKSLLESIYGLIENKIIVSPIVPMKKVNGYFEYTPPIEGSAAIAIKNAVPKSTKVVATYQNIPAHKLKDVGFDIKHDAVICSDDEYAKKILFDLTYEINGMRPLDGGPLATSNIVESITPLILNLTKLNNLKNIGVNFL